MIGGTDERDELVNECLLLDKITTSQYSWKKVYECVCVFNDECMCIVRLINNTILVLMYIDVRLVTDYILSLVYTRHKNAKNAAQH